MPQPPRSLRASSEPFDSLSADWDDLVRRQPDASVFATPTWNQRWCAHFDSEGATRFVALREGGRLRGVLPMHQQGDTLAFPGGTDLVDVHQLAQADHAEDLGQHALKHLLGDSSWRTLRLLSMREGGSTHRSLVAALEEAGLAVRAEHEDVAPAISLPSDPAAWLASLAKRDRHEIVRKERRLATAGEVEHRLVSEPAAVASELPTLLALMRQSLHPEKAAYLTSVREAFLRDVVPRLASEGRARLYELRIDDGCVAASLVFTMGERHEAYNAGYDPAYATLSVGLLNHVFAIRRAINAGATTYDLLRGSEAYKYRLGAKDRVLVRLEATRPGS